MVSVGYESSTSATLTFSASKPAIVVTGIRVARTHGTPRMMMAGSETMRSTTGHSNPAQQIRG
ncbi:MAG TPA: hypothetical protein VIJ15_07975 [Dermatophilaceae bacterium]